MAERQDGTHGGEPDKKEKRLLREHVLAQRRAHTQEHRSRVGAAIRNSLLEVPWLTMAGTVASYYSVGSEPDTRRLVTALWKRGTYVLLPVFLPDGNLDWAAFDGPDSLTPAGQGLLEPTGRRYGPEVLARADTVICPALAVDREGMRLGRGAGCYDRALAYKGPHTPAIALVHDEELVESVPGEPHDRPVDAVVTPGGGLQAFVPGSPVWPGG